MKGHLFVVHGKSERLVHDAAVIPVDEILDFHTRWQTLLGDLWRPVAPDTWSEGWGRVETSNRWLVCVGDGDYDLVLDRLQNALTDIAAKALDPLHGRGLPMVAVPVIGIDLGGHGHERGRVVRSLVDLLTTLAPRLGIDIALITPDSSVYAAVQFARREGANRPQSDTFEAEARRLGTLARKRELALFLGAGVSIPAGLMAWHRLVEALAAEIDGFDLMDLDGLTATDQAELVERANPEGFQKRVADLVSPAHTPSLLHALLAGLDSAEVVTTNYDHLYEEAVAATRRSTDSVMPWASAQGVDRWVLKLHGDVAREDSIVLTRRHMVTFDSTNRPSGALLQSLFLTRHLLVVGASMTDDNVIRLAHEVQAYREQHQSPPGGSFGTVLDASSSGDKVRARLWEAQFDWLHLATMSVDPPTRALEIFLDRVGMHASRDASWLLDARFTDLLEKPDRVIAQKARELADIARSGSADSWAPLLDHLEELGA